eukprot:TRINITY_DN20139_c2_g1_i2.p1 TRINITY_DN20139_c2_g1~~TRINITY_DN20139_c2_g1_i2.p1  ORF type:complete len:393 (+),score=104.67 TRINITY_DN20139_c2_g1_i2:147-1325(+)
MISRSLIVLALLIAIAVATEPYTVTTTSLNVRKGKGTKYAIVRQVKQGDVLEVSAIDGGWAKIADGYVSADYIKKATSSVYTVTTDSLNIRSGPGTSYSVVKTAKKGDQLNVFSLSNGWAKVTNGYVSDDYISKGIKETESKKDTTPKDTTPKDTTPKDTKPKDTSSKDTSALGRGGSWPSFVKRVSTELKTVWTYEGKWPQGLIVHYNAGGDDYSGAFSSAKSNGYCFMFLNRAGKLYAANDVSKGGYHTGTKHHKFSVGVEISSFGILTAKKDGSYTAWTGKTIPKAEVRCGARDGNARKGCYHSYTNEQESSLKKLILWYKWADPNQKFSFDKVIGHDEACDQAGEAGRKVDPGWALSMTMAKFRKQLQTEYDALLKKSAKEQKAYFGY